LIEDFLILNWQKTLRHSIWCRGVGLHSGKTCKVELAPADADTGIVFLVMQGDDEIARIPATIDHVTSSSLRTQIGNDGHTVDTIEHLIAALASRAITNCIIKIWGPEVPIHDGSASSWCFLLDRAGMVEQQVAAPFIQVSRTIEVSNGDTWCRLSPSSSALWNYDLHYTHPLIGEQSYQFEMSQYNFDREIARSRTFGFYKDALQVQSMGLGRGVTLHNTLIYTDTALMSPGGSHWDNELARHKICDAIGDLRLCGHYIVGEFRGHRSGHELNHALVRALLRDPNSYIKTPWV
jgi:UDP-3-O-[3-hydroxymyristoyl] N-acetylglucosamine deacetylase